MATTNKALGPYYEKGRGRWRVRYHIEGLCISQQYDSATDAVAAIAEFEERERDRGRTVGKALAWFAGHQLEAGVLPQTARTAHSRLTALLTPALDTPIHLVTPKDVAALYAAYRQRPTRTGRRPSVDTHRNALNQCRAFFAWAVDQGLTEANPVADVKGVGRRNAGKVQLTDVEARRLSEVCLAENSALSIGVLCALWLGMRASEICALNANDLGSLSLYVRKAKTKAGVRRLLVPADLRDALRSHLPFNYDRHALARALTRLCKEAGVTVVCLHGLRGTHATLAREAAVSGPAVAAALGHASESVTKKHYYAEGVTDRADQRRLMSVLAGGKR